MKSSSLGPNLCLDSGLVFSSNSRKTTTTKTKVILNGDTIEKGVSSYMVLRTTVFNKSNDIANLEWFYRQSKGTNEWANERNK